MNQKDYFKCTIDFINLDKDEKIDTISGMDLSIKDIDERITKIKDDGFMLVANNVTDSSLKKSHYLTVTFRKAHVIHVYPAGRGTVIPPKFRNK